MFAVVSRTSLGTLFFVREKSDLIDVHLMGFGR